MSKFFGKNPKKLRLYHPTKSSNFALEKELNSQIK